MTKVDVHTEISAGSQHFSFLIIVSHEIQSAEGQKNDRKCEHVYILMDYTKSSEKKWENITEMQQKCLKTDQTLINLTN